MLKLNLGCGTNVLAGWENHDADVDLRQPLPWPDGAARFILLEHTLEHFNSAAGYSILEECFRVLEPGGVLRVCVPDVTRVAQADPDYAEFLASQGWGSSPVKALAQRHGHEMLWTYESLSAVLASIGFRPQRAQPRVSLHPELCNVDGHHKVIGVKFNDVETLVVEATKPQSREEPLTNRAGPSVAKRLDDAATTGLKAAIVVCTNGKSFASAQELIDSIEAHRPDNSVGVRVLDLGLTDAQRNELGERVESVVSVTGVLGVSDLPRQFADVQLFIHIASDAWLQDWRAIDLLQRAAADGSLAIVPQLHPSFEHLHQPVNAVRTAMRRVYAAAFGEELARQITWRPVFDVGVFALRSDSDFWDTWQRTHQITASRTNDPLVEQVAMNVAIATSGPRVHPLPQWANWPCELALPMFDEDRGVLVEPTLPNEVISVVRAGERRGKQLELRTTKGGTITRPLV